MSKESLSERLMYLDEEKGFSEEDVKKKIQKAQRRIEANLHWKFDEGTLAVIMREVNKIFLEEFGDKLI